MLLSQYYHHPPHHHPALPTPPIFLHHFSLFSTSFYLFHQFPNFTLSSNISHSLLSTILHPQSPLITTLSLLLRHDSAITLLPCSFTATLHHYVVNHHTIYHTITQHIQPSSTYSFHSYPPSSIATTPTTLSAHIHFFHTPFLPNLHNLSYHLPLLPTPTPFHPLPNPLSLLLTPTKFHSHSCSQLSTPPTSVYSTMPTHNLPFCPHLISFLLSTSTTST